MRQNKNKKIALIITIPKRFIWLLVICYLLTLPAYAQDPSAAKGEPRQRREETPQTRLTQDVEAETSWFSITFKEKDKERKVGYIKEVRSKTTYQQQPAWRISRDTVFTSLIPNQPKKTEELYYVNQNNLSLIKGSLTIYQADRSVLRVDIQYTEDKIVFTYRPPGLPVEVPVSPQEKIYPIETIGDLLAMRGLKENKSYRIKIIYPSRQFQPITELAVTIQRKTKETIMEESVEGYECYCRYIDPNLKEEPIGLTIDTKGRILKYFQGELLTITRVSEKDARFKLRERFEKNNRRDPFIPKDKNIVSGGQPPPLQPPNDKLTQLDAVRLVGEARGALKNMQDIDEKYQPGNREKLLAKEYLKIRRIYEQINKTDYSHLKEQITEIRDAADKIFPGAKLVYLEAKHLRDESEQIFGEIQTEGKGALKKGIFDRLVQKLRQINPLQDELVITGTEYEPKVKTLVDKVKEFNRRAGIISEFYNRKLKIDGFIYHRKREVVSYPPLKITFLGAEIMVPVTYCRYRPDSSVMINNTFYKEGKKIDGNTLIRKIGEDKIYFIYKGEEIKIAFR